ESIPDIAQLRSDDEFSVRTIEGLQALVASLLPLAREQERLAAGMLNDASFFSRLLPFLPAVHRLAEPAILLLLAGNALARAAECTPAEYVSVEDYAQQTREPGSIDAPTPQPHALESSSLGRTAGGLVAGAFTRLAEKSAEKSDTLRSPWRWGVRAAV